MGRPVVYTGTKYYGRGRRHKTVRSSFGVGKVSFQIISITAIAVLMSMYISKSVTNNQNDAVLNNLTQQKNDLSRQLDAYQVEEARNANAATTKKQAEDMGMVQTSNEEHLPQK